MMPQGNIIAREGVAVREDGKIKDFKLYIFLIPRLAIASRGFYHFRAFTKMMVNPTRFFVVL